jgi:hypothetical protein|nr:MAG TPA: hypothetical protein [Siphoviridae sp. cta6m1]
MENEKYCPLASIRGSVGSKCIGEQCAWWIEDCSACVFVTSLRTSVEDLKEQNLELAGSVVSYDIQLHELEKENLRLRKAIERLSRSSLRGEKSCMS